MLEWMSLNVVHSFFFSDHSIHLSSLCILSVKRQTTGRNTKESSAVSVCPGCEEVQAADGLRHGQVTVTNYWASSGSVRSFGLGGPRDNSMADAVEKYWLAAGAAHASSLIATGTALLVAGIYCHSQPNTYVLSLFWDRKNSFFIYWRDLGGCLHLFVYTCEENQHVHCCDSNW